MWLWMAVAMASEPSVAGTWQRIATQAEVDAVHASAVQTTLDSLPWAFRGLARGPVSRVVSSCGTVAIELTDGEFATTCDNKDRRPVQRPSNGRTTVNDKGETVTVTLRAAPTDVWLEQRTEEGGVQVRYHLDGDVLVVDKAIVSSRLEEPTRWSVRYRRTAG